MQIQTQCQCGTKFAFSTEQVGQTFRCSVCHQVFQVPTPGQKPIMTSVEDYAPPQKFQPAPGRRSRGGGGMGCVVCVLLIFLMFIGGGVALVSLFAASSRSVSRSIREVEAFKIGGSVDGLAKPGKLISRYTEKGYQKVSDQDAEQGREIEQDSLFTQQVLELTVDSKANLALLSQTATLHGDINGDVDFYGQTLKIKKGSVIHGDLNLGIAQSVIVDGIVEGKLTGEFNTIQGAENVQGGIDTSTGLLERVKQHAENVDSSTSVEWTQDGVLVEAREIKAELEAEAESLRDELENLSNID